MDTETTARFEAQLRSRLAELQERLGEIEHDLDEPVDPSFADQATERELDEVLEGLGNAGLTEVKQIQAALNRIEDGTFGTCMQCGEPISQERLALLPHAASCKRCA